MEEKKEKIKDHREKDIEEDHKRFFPEKKENDADSEIIGVILLELGKAYLAIIRGTRIGETFDVKGYIMRKHRKGGQSARRFERIREEQKSKFFKKVIRQINESFLPLNGDLKRIYFGGNVLTTKDFLRKYKEDIDYRLRDKISDDILTADLMDEHGVRTLLKQIADLETETKLGIEKKEWDTFLEQLMKDGNVVYGENEVLAALKNGQVEKVLIQSGIVSREILDLVKETNIETVEFSDDTESGIQLAHFGGIVGFLRWK